MRYIKPQILRLVNASSTIASIQTKNPSTALRQRDMTETSNFCNFLYSG
jgi:hypothetical protein